MPVILELRPSIAPAGRYATSRCRPVKDDKQVELARLVQLGFSSATASLAVEPPTAHVGAPVGLAERHMPAASCPADCQ